MESLSYAFEGRGLLFADDIELQLDDGLVRSRNQLKRWDAEPLSLPIRDAVESMEFVEPGLPDVMRKSVLNNKSLQSIKHFSNDDSCKSITSTITLNSLAEFGSRFSHSALRANDQNSSPTDSRNDKLAALKEPRSNQFAVENSMLPSSEPPVSAKRVRITNLQSQTPVCQVLNCNRDLSSSKDYHKRHKVCDLHSKTAVVIVNGIQQRFCQQCSRFHLLPEFDEGKRSCRKRLAGHNERRRKPQLDTHLGSMFFGTDLSRTPFLFPKILQGGFFHHQCNEPMNHSRHIKLEEESSQISQTAAPSKFRPSHSESLFHLQSMGKQYPSKNCLNTPFSVQELSADSNSCSALSLLSSQSQNFSGNSAGMSMAHPLILKENQHANLRLDQSCANVFGKSALKNFTPSVFKSFDGVDQESFPVIPNASVSAALEFPQNLLSQESNVPNVKCYPPPEVANTVDLLQLSLHLQRVEHQKYSAQGNQENSIFFHSATT